MKTNYLKFAVKLLLLISMSVLIIFALGIAVTDHNIEWSENLGKFVQILTYISVVVWVMCLVTAIPSFLITVNSFGIRKGLSSDFVPWSSIDHAKISGFKHIKYFNTLVLSGSREKIELNLFVFDSQEELINYVSKHLPWAYELSLEKLPSEAHSE